MTDREITRAVQSYVDQDALERHDPSHERERARQALRCEAASQLERIETGFRRDGVRMTARVRSLIGAETARLQRQAREARDAKAAA